MHYTHFYSSDKQIAALVTTNAYFPSAKASGTPTKTANTVQEGDETKVEDNLILWGDDNLWPQKTYALIRKDDILPALIKWKTDVIYAGGLVYGAEYMENGQRVFKELMIQPIEDWLECTDIDLYLNEAPRDMHSYGNFYPKFIPDASGKTIKHLYVEDASTCRMGKQGKNGHINQVGVHGDWANADKPAKTYPAVDRYGDVQAQIEKLDKKHFIIPSFYRLNGNVAYELPTWYGLVEGGWLELSHQIPIFKKTKMANSAVIRLHVEINDKYFIKKYKGWGVDKEKYTEDKVKEILAEECKAILDSVSGHDKTGKIFMSGFEKTPGGEEESMFKIHNLNDKNEGGDYIEDSQEVDYKKVRAFGVPATLFGVTPGSKTLAGSGSEGRVAMNHYIMTNFNDQKKILYPLQVVATRNNWHQLARDAAKIPEGQPCKLVFKARNHHIAKLEEGKEIKKAPDGTDNNQ